MACKTLFIISIPKQSRTLNSLCPMVKTGRRKDLFSTNTHLKSVVCVHCCVICLFGFAPSIPYCEQMRKLILTN